MKINCKVKVISINVDFEARKIINIGYMISTQSNIEIEENNDEGISIFSSEKNKSMCKRLYFLY